MCHLMVFPSLRSTANQMAIDRGSVRTPPINFRLSPTFTFLPASVGEIRLNHAFLYIKTDYCMYTVDMFFWEPAANRR